MRNFNELGISNEILYKAANLTQEELESGLCKRGKAATKAQAMGGSLRRVIPILVAEQKVTKGGGNALEAPMEVQVLIVADDYESLVSGTSGKKMSPAQAEEAIIEASETKYNSMVVDAFIKAFGQHARGVGV